MSGNSENKMNGIENFQNIINLGRELIAGAFPGVLIGSPEAALYGASGAVASIGLKALGEKFSRRHLGPREEAKVGALLVLASEEISKRMERGDSLREDGFFNEKATGGKDSEEVIESVLLKCQREPEAKKIKYMAKLLSNICFDSEISADTAHRIMKVAEQLTYRQLCILKICAIKDSLDLRKENYRSRGYSNNLYAILYDYHDLYLNGYIGFPDEKVEFGPMDLVPGRMDIQDQAEDIFELMGLGDIPQEDLHQIVRDIE